MKRTCLLSGDQFDVTEMEQEYCTRFDVPLPVLSPRERLRELAVRRNRVHLFPSTCGLTGKRLLSMIPPESAYTVYDPEVWFSDDWDPLSFGRPYDFSRTFFEQWFELAKSVPLPSRSVVVSSLENSEYTNGILGAKNCYLLFASNYNEECLFSISVNRSQNLYDCVHVNDSQLCYECADVQGCYQLRYSEHCVSCSDSFFLSNCQSCRNCFGCVNLLHKEHCYFNEQLTKEEYERRIAAFDCGSAAAVAIEQERFAAFQQAFPLRAYFGMRNEGSSGNFLNGTKNCQECHFVTESEDVLYSMRLLKTKNSIAQLGYGIGTELIYNSATVGEDSYNLRFCSDCWGTCRDLEYCIACHFGTASCFGSIGLRRQSYCILNKQYRKEEYFDLVARIRAQMRTSGEYGRFFPPHYSPYAYNASEVNDYFPLNRSGAEALGFHWRQEEPANEASDVTVPDSAADLPADAASIVYRCTATGRPYRLVRQEIDFYRAHRIPPPSVAPLERIKTRLEFYRIAPLMPRTCSKCREKIVAVASQCAAGGAVLCERCFQDALR